MLLFQQQYRDSVVWSQSMCQKLAAHESSRKCEVWPIVLDVKVEIFSKWSVALISVPISLHEMHLHFTFCNWMGCVACHYLDGLAKATCFLSMNRCRPIYHLNLLEVGRGEHRNKISSRVARERMRYRMNYHFAAVLY